MLYVETCTPSFPISYLTSESNMLVVVLTVRVSLSFALTVCRSVYEHMSAAFASISNSPSRCENPRYFFGKDLTLRAMSLK